MNRDELVSLIDERVEAGVTKALEDVTANVAKQVKKSVRKAIENGALVVPPVATAAATDAGNEGEPPEGSASDTTKSVPEPGAGGTAAEAATSDADDPLAAALARLD